MPKPNALWIARTRIHRLVRWIDGVETEFPVSFAQLSDNEKELIVTVLKGLCDELDTRGECPIMESAKHVVFAAPVKVTEMREPKRDSPESGF
jgi:hypothetical protein